MGKPITVGRMVFYAFLAVTVPICIIVSFDDSSSSSSGGSSEKNQRAVRAVSKPAPRRYNVTVEQLDAAFTHSKNPKYAGAMLTVTGVVHDYQSEPTGRGEAIILGFVPEESTHRQGSVRCWFVELPERPARGTKVKVSGKCKGKDPLYIDMVFGRLL